MAALRSRCGHYIFALWFLPFFLHLLSSFFLAYSQRLEIGSLPYFYTWYGLSANLECRSEMCCTRLAGNTGHKNCHLRTIAQVCRAVSSQLMHVLTIGKKLIKQQYVLHMSPQHGELRPTKGWDRFWSLGHRSKFQRVSRLAFITAATLLTRGRPNCTMFGRLLRWYTIYTFSGAVAFWQNFARCKIHFKSKPCIRLYWQCYCTALQQWSSAKLWGSCRRNGIAEFCTGYNLYSAARPSRWASAHILVDFTDHQLLTQ